MAKADLSDDVIKIAIGAILVGGIYLIYTTSRAGRPIITATQETGAAIQKPFAWTAEGLEWWADYVTGGTQKQQESNGRSLLGKDPDSWGWGYGPKKGWLF